MSGPAVDVAAACAAVAVAWELEAACARLLEEAIAAL
jgi:hypothetical protein